MEPPDSLLQLQKHFHSLIRERAGALVDKYKLELPSIGALPFGNEEKEYLGIPGMYGGFAYWLEGTPECPRLMSESWSRVTEGSGQRHEITVNGAILVAKGFV